MLEGTKLYSELQKAVTEYAKTKGEYQSRRDALAELYKNIENADIDAELTADLVGDYLFTDAEFVNNLSANHRNVFQKIYDEVKYLCKIATAGSKEARQLEKVKKTFEDAFRAETKNTAQEGGVKYAISPTFEAEYDAWDKTSKGGYFKLGSTSQALESIGINSSDIYWDKSKIIKIKQDHPEMTDDIIKQIPYLLEYPVMVMQSQTAVNRVVAFGEVYADGNPVLCALELKPNGRIDNFIKVASAYSKKGAQNLINTSDILYLDPNKNRTDNWLKALRLQLPAGVTNYGSIGSVTYTNKNVKGEIVFGNDTNTKSAIQEALERAGYTVDQNGQIQYMPKNQKNSLSAQNDDLGPIGDYNVYGKDVALEGSLPDDFAPIAEMPNSQTSVDSDEVLDNEAEWTYNIPEPKYETHRSFAETVVDNISVEEIENGVNKAIREYAINEDESVSLQAYVAGAAYDMTRAQRSGDHSEQSEYEAYLENQVRAGLLKHPTYTGSTYRNLDFDTVFNSDEDYNAFLKEHTAGKIIDLNAFTSASKEPNGYPTIGKKAVHLVIYGQSAREISETYNGQQQEVIYLPGTKYRVVRVTTANDGNPLIYGKEITDNEVQQLQGNTSSTESINGIEGIPQGQEYDNDRVSKVGRVYERTEGTDQLSKTVQIHGNRRSETQAERNEIAPFEKASSEDGVFFDGENIDDDLGPIAQEPAVQEPTETESDVKTENSNLSVRELYQQKLSNHKNAFAALETDKSNSLSSFDEAIRKKLVEYNGLKDKNTKRANTLLQQIENLRLRRDNVQADYANRIAKQQARIEAFESKSFEEFENETLAVSPEYRI